MSDKDPSVIFDARETLLMFEKRISSVTDLFMETQKMVHGFEIKVDSLSERINKGLSPTMQEIKKQNEELDKSILKLESKLELQIQAVNNSVIIATNRFDEKIRGYDELKKEARGFLWKMAGVGLVAIAGMFLGMWVFFQQLKATYVPPTKSDILSKYNTKTPRGE